MFSKAAGPSPTPRPVPQIRGGSASLPETEPGIAAPGQIRGSACGSVLLLPGNIFCAAFPHLPPRARPSPLQPPCRGNVLPRRDRDRPARPLLRRRRRAPLPASFTTGFSIFSVRALCAPLLAASSSCCALQGSWPSTPLHPPNALPGLVDREKRGDLGTHPPHAASRGLSFPYRFPQRRGEGEETVLLPFSLPSPPST